MIKRYSFALFLAIGLSIWFYLELDYTSPPRSFMRNLNYTCFNQEYNDILYIGSSRVLRQFNPQVIDSVLQKKSYCLGFDAIGIVESKMLLKKYLQVHPKPKVIVLNIDITDAMFNTNFKGPYNRDDYYPYLSDTLIYNELAKYNYRFRYFKVLSFYYKLLHWVTLDDEEKVHSFTKNISKKPANDYFTYRGFIGLEPDWNKADEDEIFTKNLNPSQAPTTEAGFLVLEEFIQLCHDNSISVILVNIPWYYNFSPHTNHEQILSKVAQIASKTKTPIKRFSYFSFSNDTTYFADPYHFNLAGANLFSLLFAQELSKLL
jgi:hypothetical protein